MVEIRRILEKMFRWKRLYSYPSEDMPKVEELDRELYATTCIDCKQKEVYLIEKETQALTLRSKMMQSFTKLIQGHEMVNVAPSNNPMRSL